MMRDTGVRREPVAANDNAGARPALRIDFDAKVAII
jgi:hypothetical protein